MSSILNTLQVIANGPPPTSFGGKVGATAVGAVVVVVVAVPT